MQAVLELLVPQYNQFGGGDQRCLPVQDTILLSRHYIGMRNQILRKTKDTGRLVVGVAPIGLRGYLRLLESI